mmetsp:Transcript_3752/g.13883  ORF Transcript_3752/g.13883 Transcript_3752/m.13883 type:complete len:206 (-) Transcript_3752:86-703(-)
MGAFSATATAAEGRGPFFDPTGKRDSGPVGHQRPVELRTQPPTQAGTSTCSSSSRSVSGGGACSNCRESVACKGATRTTSCRTSDSGPGRTPCLAFSVGPLRRATACQGTTGVVGFTGRSSPCAVWPGLTNTIAGPGSIAGHSSAVVEGSTSGAAAEGSAATVLRLRPGSAWSCLELRLCRCRLGGVRFERSTRLRRHSSPVEAR